MPVSTAIRDFVIGYFLDAARLRTGPDSSCGSGHGSLIKRFQMSPSDLSNIWPTPLRRPVESRIGASSRGFTHGRHSDGPTARIGCRKTSPKSFANLLGESIKSWKSCSCQRVISPSASSRHFPDLRKTRLCKPQHLLSRRCRHPLRPSPAGVTSSPAFTGSVEHVPRSHRARSLLPHPWSNPSMPSPDEDFSTAGGPDSGEVAGRSNPFLDSAPLRLSSTTTGPCRSRLSCSMPRDSFVHGFRSGPSAERAGIFVTRAVLCVPVLSIPMLMRRTKTEEANK